MNFYIVSLLSSLATAVVFASGVGTELFLNIEFRKVQYFVIFGFLCGIVILYILMFMNKKFYSWYKYELDDNGEMKEPKVNTLALYEWINYLLFFITILVLSVFIYLY